MNVLSDPWTAFRTRVGRCRLVSMFGGPNIGLPEPRNDLFARRPKAEMCIGLVLAAMPVFMGLVLAAVPVFMGLVLAAVPVFMGCAAGVEATSARRAGPTPPVVALAPAPASAAASALGAASTAPVAAPPAPDLAWLSARGAGPLCAAQAQGARRRLEAIGRVFGADYFNARFARREERNEAFFCREEASVAWSVSVAGLDDESAAPCSPEADQACAERAALATRAAVRAVEAGQEARTCWSVRHTDPAPCDEAGEAGSFQGVGELLHDRAHGWLPHAQLADVDADGRPEFVFLYRDSSGLRDHSWYVALRAAGPGRPIEQHPAFSRPSVVGFVDVDRDGRRDLLTRASVVHCTGLQPDGSEAMLCHGSDAPLLCRLFGNGRFGPPRPCPPYPGAMPDAPERGWSPPAVGRCPSRLHERTPPRRGRRIGRPPRRRRSRPSTRTRPSTWAQLSTQARPSTWARLSTRARLSTQARLSTRARPSMRARLSTQARPSMRAWLEAVMP